jgi:hypothetical protein
MSEKPTEVRQCPKCHIASVVQVMEWQHVSGSVSLNQQTTEFRCQQCGSWFVRRPTFKIAVFWILGVLFLPMCLLGVPFLVIAWRQHTFEKRLPVVAGAPVPQLRFPGGPPKRTCHSCGAVCVATKITRNTHNGVPTGTDFEYQCTSCKVEFETEDVLGHCGNTFASLMFLGIAALFVFQAQKPGWRWGGSLVSLGFALLIGFQTGRRILNQFQNPPIVERIL